MDNNEWIDVKEKLPPDRTWVEAIYRVPNTNVTLELEWFYFSDGYDDFHKRRITHWRFITHSFFNPVTDQSVSLELPDNATGTTDQ